MTYYLDKSYFDREEGLNQGTLGSLVVKSAANIFDTLQPLGFIFEWVQNMASVMYVADPWGKKLDAPASSPEPPPDLNCW